MPMKIGNLTTVILLCTLFAGCQRDSTLPPSTGNAILKSAVVDTNPRELFYRLTPPCSAGSHFLPAPDDAIEYVWLFGAYNNGRHEENVLIEKNGKSVRLRAFWHLRSGDLVCCDTEIDFDEFKKLQSKLLDEQIFHLPNLSPDVSHAMTYWLKFSDGSDNHESCAYCIDLDLPGGNTDDQTSATRWKNTVSTILSMRLLAKSELRNSGFDEQGNVEWGGEIIPESEITSDFFN